MSFGSIFGGGLGGGLGIIIGWWGCEVILLEIFIENLLFFLFEDLFFILFFCKKIKEVFMCVYEYLEG